MKVRKTELPVRPGTTAEAEHPLDCEHCRNIHAFDMPPHLMTELYAKRVVVFAGAGASTESVWFPIRLYDKIADELGLDTDTGLAFPDLMEEFCKRPNGRRLLLERIQAHFEYFDAFPELRAVATRFHAELASVFLVDTIVTTNWDPYFEQECGARPLVSAQDVAFGNLPGRKVFKLHGSIANVGSVVATRSDYERFAEELRTGLLGSTLRMLLATKTILFVGYSLRDSDFLQVHEILRKEMGNLFPHAYALTLEDDLERFEELGITPIRTDAAHFMETVKKHLVQDGHLLPDSHFSAVAKKLKQLRTEHRRLYNRLDVKTHPEVLYAGTYQDGLIHAFERMLAKAHTGEYSHVCELPQRIEQYEEIRRRKVRERKYADAAYAHGYRNGLMFLLEDPRDAACLPLYFIFGADHLPVTFKDFEKVRKRAKRLHKTSYEQARKRMDRYKAGIVPHHGPFLD